MDREGFAAAGIYKVGGEYYAAEDLPVVLPEQVDNAWQRFHALRIVPGNLFIVELFAGVWRLYCYWVSEPGYGGILVEVLFRKYRFPAIFCRVARRLVWYSQLGRSSIWTVRQQQWSDRQAQISCDTSGQIVYEQMTESREPAF